MIVMSTLVKIFWPPPTMSKFITEVEFYHNSCWVAGVVWLTESSVCGRSDSVNGCRIDGRVLTDLPVTQPVPSRARILQTLHKAPLQLHAAQGCKKGFRDYLFKDYCRGRLINNAPIYRFLCSNMTKNIQILCVPSSLAMNMLFCAIKSVWFTATAAHAACILLNPHPVSEFVLSNDATKTIKIVSLALVNIFSM